MSASEKSAVKSLLSMHRTYAELDEYLEKALKEAGYAGVDVQKNPVGSRITVFVTRPGLAIGRRGTGIKDLTERVAAKFPLPNPQIAVSEVESPELNPRIMAARISQIVARGTAFRRAANWTMNSIMAAGAAGVEIGVAGKLRSDRSHSEKYRMGVVPKSGEASKRVVREATTDVLLKLGLYGIQVKIAIKDAVPPMVEFIEQTARGGPGGQGRGKAVPSRGRRQRPRRRPEAEGSPARQPRPKGERAPESAQGPKKAEKTEKAERSPSPRRQRSPRDSDESNARRSRLSPRLVRDQPRQLRKSREGGTSCQE